MKTKLFTLFLFVLGLIMLSCNNDTPFEPNNNAKNLMQTNDNGNQYIFKVYFQIIQNCQNVSYVIVNDSIETNYLYYLSDKIQFTTRNEESTFDIYCSWRWWNCLDPYVVAQYKLLNYKPGSVFWYYFLPILINQSDGFNYHWFFNFSGLEPGKKYQYQLGTNKSTGGDNIKSKHNF